MEHFRRIRIFLRAKCIHSGIHILSHLILLLRWTIYSILIGLLVGGTGILFAFCLNQVTTFRTQHSWMLFGLPLCGLLIVWLYHISKNDNDKGTNLVIATLQSQSEVPGKMAPLIFVSTILTHACGGSAGREGAALQLGGSMGSVLGKWFRIPEQDRHIVIMCSMSAAFSAVFGTPLAAAIFSMEVVSVGVMQYSALVPCTLASLTASHLAATVHLEQEAFPTLQIPSFQIGTALLVLLLAVLCAGISILFCMILHRTGALLRSRLHNAYLRVVASGTSIVLLTLLLGSRDYLGTGMSVISRALTGEVVWYAFLMKMLFTAVTLGGGYKGGEIVPSFFVGATFGCLFGQVIGFSPALCAALGMAAVFCGVTNCPLTSLLISFELFGMGGAPYFLLVIAVSYLLSGYYGLYQTQKFAYSKYKDRWINRSAKK